MDIERFDGTKEHRKYDATKDMMANAERESRNPNTRELTLHFPKMIIPKKRNRI